LGARSNIKAWAGRQDSDVTATVFTLAAFATGGLFLWWLLSDDDKSGGGSQDIPYDKNNLSYDPGYYETTADALEYFLWGNSGLASWTEDDTAIGTALLTMNTIDDVYKLLEAYDFRYVGWFIKDGGNLVESIAAYLDQDIKDMVNEEYQERGINFTWL